MDDVSLLSYVLATFHNKDETLSLRDINVRLSAVPNVPQGLSGLKSPINHILYTSGAFTRLGDAHGPNPVWTLCERNPKGALQELVQKTWGLPPTYDTREREPGWFASRIFCGQVRADGLGRSKKVAEENAARIVLVTSGNVVTDKLISEDDGDIRALVAKWAAQAHPALSKEMREWLDKQ
jgi:hypothetical protein